MLKITLRRILPRKEARLRAWLRELGTRSAEVRETFAQESVRAEKAFIIECPDGAALLYVSEAESLERARSAYASSNLPIDVEHRSVIGECTGKQYDLDALYDVSL
jgi:hypothetical protein